MAKLAAKTYGDALFALAQETGKMDQFYGEILSVSEAMQSNQELAVLMNHPKIVKEEKVQIIENIFKNLVSEEVTGFLVIIVSKGRFDEVFEILDYFIGRVKEFKKIGTAYIDTAAEIDDQQKEKIKKRLLETTSYQTIETVYRVDPELIGGMKIRIGDRVIDSSIQTKLADLSAELLKLQLA